MNIDRIDEKRKKLPLLLSFLPPSAHVNGFSSMADVNVSDSRFPSIERQTHLPLCVAKPQLAPYFPTPSHPGFGDCLPLSVTILKLVSPVRFALSAPFLFFPTCVKKGAFKRSDPHKLSSLYTPPRPPQETLARLRREKNLPFQGSSQPAKNSSGFLAPFLPSIEASGAEYSPGTLFHDFVFFLVTAASDEFEMTSFILFFWNQSDVTTYSSDTRFFWCVSFLS